ACMMVRRTFFDTLGGFDERLPLGYEDTEICWRARLHGWKTLFVPRAICWHRVGGSVRSEEAALLYFRGLLSGRLVLATKLLPSNYSFYAWLVSVAGFAQDLRLARRKFAAVRAQVLIRTLF